MELTQVPEIGDKIAASVADFLSEPRNRELVARLARAGVNMTEPAGPEGPEQPPQPPLFAGKTVVFTGTLETVTRSEAQELVENLGGRRYFDTNRVPKTMECES